LGPPNDDGAGFGGVSVYQRTGALERTTAAERGRLGGAKRLWVVLPDLAKGWGWYEVGW